MTQMPPSSGRAPCRREDAEAVLRRLREAGHVAYFAGGCVRDMLLALEPKDWDIATDAPPQRVRQLFPRTQAVGAAFGVILVRQGSSQIEVATFRTDVSYDDGRRPTAVKFTTAEEDAKRRDFTINGLFLDPIENKVIDYVGGQEDLKNKLLRAIGEADHRFEEDHLRLLRAVRFAARFDLTIEPATVAATKKHAPQLKRISPERIAEELRLMLTAPTRAIAWRMLWELGLGLVVFRNVESLREDAAVSCVDQRRSVFLNISPGETVLFGLALAAAVVDVTGGDRDVRALLEKRAVQRAAHAMRQTLRISNEESDAMEGTLIGAGQMLEGDAVPGIARMKRFLASPTADSAIELLHAFARVGEHVQRIEKVLGELKHLSDLDVAPPPLITGDDLTAAGFQPGPMFKRVLDAVYDAQLEDRITTKDQAMQLARELFH
jgi:poly(A) polymerase